MGIFIAVSVQQTSDNGYIIVGDTFSYGAGNRDIWLIKTDINGIKQWDRTFGGIFRDTPFSVKQTSDGGYIIVGDTLSYGAGDRDIWFIKTDINGIKQWDRTFGGIFGDTANSVQQTSDGGYIIAGALGKGTDMSNSDAWLIRTDSRGNELWNKRFGKEGFYFFTRSVDLTSDGGYILAGSTDSDSYGAYEIKAWLIKIAPEEETEQIPEFSTISMPIVAIICLMFLIQRGTSK